MPNAAECPFTVPVPASTWRVCVDPALRAALEVDDAQLVGEVHRIARLYLNCVEEDGPLASPADVRVTGNQPDWQQRTVASLVSGEVVEDLAYFDEATFGPLPEEPVDEVPSRYVLAGRRVWVDSEIGDYTDTRVWLLEADPAAHTKLGRLLEPTQPTWCRYGPARPLLES